MKKQIFNPKSYTQVFRLEDGSVLRLAPYSTVSIEEGLISSMLEKAIKREVVYIESTPVPVKPIEVPKGKPQDGEKKNKQPKSMKEV